MPLCDSSSGRGGFWLVEGAVAQHGEQYVAASSGESDERLIVTLALLDLARVIVPRDRVSQGSESREEECSPEYLVAPSGRVFATDGRARASGHRGEAGVGG